MKKTNTTNYTENTNRKHNNAKFLRIICVAAILTILMSCVSCFGTSAATGKAGSNTHVCAKTSSKSYLYCTADDFVALRKSATVNSTELKRIPHGDQMTYLNSKSGKWYYVKYGSQKGYVYSDYVSFTNPDAKNSTKSSNSTKKNNSSSSKSYSGGSAYNYKYYSNNNYSYNYKSTCSRCGGTGKVVCTSCHGSKKLYHTHSSPSYGMGGSSSYQTSSRCYSCSGKGTTTCTLCGGDGCI